MNTMVNALLFQWEPPQIVGFEEVLWHVLTRPNLFDTSFVDHARLPGTLLHPEWTSEGRVTDLLHWYRSMLTEEERLEPVAVTGIKCITLLLFAYDMRFRRLFFGDHGIHDILNTVRLQQHVKGEDPVHERGLLFMDHIHSVSGQWIADLGVAPPEEHGTMAVNFLDLAQRLWTYSEDLPWPSPDDL